MLESNLVQSPMSEGDAATLSPSEVTGHAAHSSDARSRLSSKALGSASQPVVEQAPRSEGTKDGPESSRRRSRSQPLSIVHPPPQSSQPLPRSDTPLTIPGMPTPVTQTPDRPPVSMPMTPSEKPALHAAAADASQPQVRTESRRRVRPKSQLPLIQGEFTADDILLWLSSTAFKHRAHASASDAQSVQRSRILAELRGQQRQLRG